MLFKGLKEQNHSNIQVKLTVTSPNTQMLWASTDMFGHHLPKHPAKDRLNLLAALGTAL
jgi:hypothetical protein